MARSQVFNLVFLIICIAISSAKHLDKYAEAQNEVVELLKNYANLHDNGRSGTDKVARDLSSDCHTNEEVIKMKNSISSPLGNLIHMCGTTTAEEEVPVNWIVVEGPDNEEMNVTLTKNQSRIVPLCCHGYVRNKDDICVPNCKGKCHNGVCVSPGKCECYKDHILNSVGNCVVTCPCGCPHGHCSGDQCVCDPGYALGENGKECNPLCSPACENGQCVRPNKCKCDQGYKKVPHNSHRCTPHCSNGCHNGDCISPDVCACHEGYYKQDHISSCVPKCDGCENGTCIKPFTCQCNHGYQKVNETCQPICEEGCFNATCVSPDHCRCWEGYEIKHITEWNHCVPKCEPPCINAHCAKPGHCECKPGYHKNHGLPYKNMCTYV